jgi:hypothetical protein
MAEHADTVGGLVAYVKFLAIMILSGLVWLVVVGGLGLLALALLVWTLQTLGLA